MRGLFEGLPRATHPTAPVPGASALAGHNTENGSGGTTLSELGRKEAALGTSDLCRRADLAKRGKAGNPLLQERGCQGHLRGRGRLFPAFAIGPMALVRLPAISRPGTRGSQRDGYSARERVRRRMKRQVRITNMRALSLEPRACSRLGREVLLRLGLSVFF